MAMGNVNTGNAITNNAITNNATTDNVEEKNVCGQTPLEFAVLAHCVESKLPHHMDRNIWKIIAEYAENKKIEESFTFIITANDRLNFLANIHDGFLHYTT
jgi:hypothetical protein